MTGSSSLQAVTVTLNPAVDCTVTIPGFTPGAVNRVEAQYNVPGGKGVNVAFTLASLGHHTAATGFLGRDNSALFEEAFVARKIEDHFIRLAGATRMGIKVVDPNVQQTTDINFPGLSPSVSQSQSLLKVMQSLEAPWFVLAGSVPQGVDAGIYRDLVKHLRSSGSRVMMDTSGEPLRLALEATPTAIKPNIHELSELVGSPLETREAVFHAASELLQRGIELVVISMGGEGALFVTKHEAVTVKPPSIPVHSTVGAGDAMVAGTVAGALRGLSLADQARLATACSIHILTQRPPQDFNQTAIEKTMSLVTVI